MLSVWLISFLIFSLCAKTTIKVNIDSDEEYEIVSDAFDEELDAMEYEELYEQEEDLDAMEEEEDD